MHNNSVRPQVSHKLGANDACAVLLLLSLLLHCALQGQRTNKRSMLLDAAATAVGT